MTARYLALFIHNLSGGGAQRSALTLAHAFAARGHKVDLIVPSAQGSLLHEVSPQVRLVALDPWWIRQPWVRSREHRWPLFSVPALLHYLQRERPEVLLLAGSHVTRAVAWALTLTPLVTRLVIRMSNHLSQAALKAHRRPRRFRLWLARHFYPRADAIIAISNGVADDLAHVTGLPRERITTIYNPVITPELKEKARAPLDHPWFAHGSPCVLLGIGRLVPQKDFPTLLKAFARVRAVRKARLVILGEGIRRMELETLVRELDVAADVALPGFVANPFPYIARASVLVLSSAWEGLGNVLIEAMACGCPVVSTDCPSGPAEILDGGAYGPLVPVRDDEALAKAILSVLEKPPDRERLRARAALFSVDRAADRYLQVLLGVV